LLTRPVLPVEDLQAAGVNSALQFHRSAPCVFILHFKHGSPLLRHVAAHKQSARYRKRWNAALLL